MFLPSSVRIAIYIRFFLMLLFAFSAAGFLLRYSEILPGCVLRSQYQDFRFLLFWSSRTAYLRVFEVHSLRLPPLFFCKLYCLHFVLIFILFIFWHPFFLHFFCSHFTSLRLVCQVLLYYIKSRSQKILSKSALKSFESLEFSKTPVRVLFCVWKGEISSTVFI